MPDLTREQIERIQRLVDTVGRIAAGESFTIEGIDAKFRAAVVVEETLLDYQLLGAQLGIAPGVLPSILLAIGGCVLAEAVKLQEKKALEVPPGAPLN